MSTDTSPEACQAVLEENQVAPTSDISKGTKLSHAATNVLFNSYSNLCRFFDNQSSTNDYFIPQASASEFSSVIQNLPANVGMGNCVFPVPTGTSTFTATSTIDYASFQIFSEGGAMSPTSPDVATKISGIAVPTVQGIMRVPQNGIPVYVINGTSNAPIQFTYTRQDCLPAPNNTLCNTWTIKEDQVQYYDAVPSNPPGNDGHWVWNRTVSTFYVNLVQGSTASWQQISGPTADYRPPALQSCTMNGTTYNSGTSWTTAVTSSQTPTASECPFGAGTRMDTMSTTTHYTCDNGTADVDSTDTPVETGSTGTCGSGPSTPLIYVSDSMNNRIEVFDNTGKFLLQFGTGGSGNGQFNQPWDIRIDASQNLFVTDSGNHRVEKFDNTGNFLAQIGSQGTGMGHFDTPDNAQANPITNQLWVTDIYLSGGMLDVFDSSGSPLLQKGGFQHPTAVAFDASGYTWISNSSTNTILQLDSNGNTLYQFGGSGSGNGQFNFVWSIAFDAMGRMWVPDSLNNRVQVFDSTGKFLFKFGTLGTGPGQFNAPLAITIDGSNNAWVTDEGNNRVEEFDNNGNFVLQFGAYGTAPGQFNQPAGITVSNPVAQPSNPQSCSVSGSTYIHGQTWTTNVLSTQAPTAAECPAGAGTRVDNFSTPTNYICDNGSATVLSAGATTQTGFTGACATPPTAQTMYVVDMSNSRVQAFDLSGNFKFKFGTNGTGATQFKVPWAIHTDTSGNLYVTDNNNQRIEKLDSNGNYLGSIGSNGTTLGKFTSPDVANFAPDGKMWVTDFNNNNVTVFDTSGNPLFQKGGFANPSGVAFDKNGNVWVSNTGTNEILKLDNSGNIVFRFGSAGTGNGQFNFAWSMVFDSSNRMWVADRNNNRIQVFDTTGKFLFKFGTLGSGNGQFNYPIDLAIDANSNIWITELNGNRVQEFDSTGAWKYTLGGSGSGNGQFNGSIGICIK